MVATTSPIVLALVALLSATTIDAHGVISKPAPKFKGTEYAGGFSADIPMSAMPAVPPDVYAQNSWADIFGRAFKQSKYKSLREFMMKNQVTANRVKNSNPMTPECGFTDPDNQSPQPLPDKIEWYGGGMNHPGPCEAWCDNEIVMPYTVNCQKSYPDGKFPYDKSKCVGKNLFSFYWMATLNQWQVYIDCVKIGNGPVPAFDGSTGGIGNNTSPAVAPKPSTGPKPVPAPRPAPKPASKPSGDSVAGEASTGSKCKRRD